MRLLDGVPGPEPTGGYTFKLSRDDNDAAGGGNDGVDVVRWEQGGFDS